MARAREGCMVPVAPIPRDGTAREEKRNQRIRQSRFREGRDLTARPHNTTRRIVERCPNVEPVRAPRVAQQVHRVRQPVQGRAHGPSVQEGKPFGALAGHARHHDVGQHDALAG